MKRREFFKTAALGSGFLAFNPLMAYSPLTEKSENDFFLKEFELDEISVSQLQKKLNNGELTSEEIIRKYLERINKFDKNGPGLNSIIEINPDAIQIAIDMDQLRKENKILGPLHGIPIMIKDNIDTNDKMMTTAGSMAMNGFYAPKDAFIVSQLRKSGAIILGKTNLSEWANIRSTRSSSGWSGRGGQVRNPYFLDRTPCGSSSGSAVAVSSNLCTLAIGTETDGSIVCPSGINGIVGIKPTVGLWSRYGIIPISHSQDTAGPMARNVEDAAILLGALTGIDPEDEATLESKGRSYTDYLQFVDPNGLKGSRIGLMKDFIGFDPNVDLLLNNVIEILKQQGVQIIEVNCAEKRNEWNDAEWTVFLFELKNDLNSYLNSRPEAPVHYLQEIIEFNNANAISEMKWFGQEIFLLANKKGTLQESEYKEALELSRKLTRETINQTIDDNKLDALIAPTNAPAWTIDWVNGDHFIGGSSDLAAISGFPSISVPMGQVHGLPIGLSFIGKAWSEPELIKLASGYEQMIHARQKPMFIQSIL